MGALEVAIGLAARYHNGQYDRRSRPYILHVIEVMMEGRSTNERIVGVLHDILEGTDCTMQALKDAGIPESILDAVDAITRRERETYEDYIYRVEQNPLARAVKVFDLELNLNTLSAVSNPGNLERRYTWAYYQLTAKKNPIRKPGE